MSHASSAFFWKCHCTLHKHNFHEFIDWFPHHVTKQYTHHQDLRRAFDTPCSLPTSFVFYFCLMMHLYFQLSPWCLRDPCSTNFLFIRTSNAWILMKWQWILIQKISKLNYILPSDIPKYWATWTFKVSMKTFDSYQCSKHSHTHQSKVCPLHINQLQACKIQNFTNCLSNFDDNGCINCSLQLHFQFNEHITVLKRVHSSHLLWAKHHNSMNIKEKSFTFQLSLGRLIWNSFL